MKGKLRAGLGALILIFLSARFANATIVLTANLSPSDFTFSRITDGDTDQDFLSATIPGPGGELTPGDDLTVHLTLAPGFALVAVPNVQPVNVALQFGQNDTGGYGDTEYEGNITFSGVNVPASSQNVRYDYVYGDGPPTGSQITFSNQGDLSNDPQAQITGLDWEFVFPAAEESATPAPISLDTFQFLFEVGPMQFSDPYSEPPLLAIQAVPEPTTFAGLLLLALIFLERRNLRRI